MAGKHTASGTISTLFLASVGIVLTLGLPLLGFIGIVAIVDFAESVSDVAWPFFAAFPLVCISLVFLCRAFFYCRDFLHRNLTRIKNLTRKDQVPFVPPTPEEHWARMYRENREFLLQRDLRKITKEELPWFAKYEQRSRNTLSKRSKGK